MNSFFSWIAGVFSAPSEVLEFDSMRPRKQPAQTIYDAFQAEASKRPGREYDEWVVAEREAVLRASVEYAACHGLRVPTREFIQEAEEMAFGADYGAKLARIIAEYMTDPHE